MRISGGSDMTAFMVFADEHGNVYDHPELQLIARSGNELFTPDDDELIAIPKHTQLFMMRDRMPIGWNERKRRIEVVDEVNGRECYAVAAFLPPGYLRTLLPAWHVRNGARILPLWAYTAVGWHGDHFVVAAMKVDETERWNPDNYDIEAIKPKIEVALERYPHNRLLHHLARCAIEYGCYNAMNVFYRRWECGIPVAPACNANCIGCISQQPLNTCPASHERITFVPTVDEIAEIAIPHLMEAEQAIVSFGQGCEGEPLLHAELIAKAIQEMRCATTRGTIHMNTNASMPHELRKLCEAGLDSIRVSINSANPDAYHAYYRPQGYTFNDVVNAIRIAKALGVFVSINLLIFPGVTDVESEFNALAHFIESTGADMIQLRNLNIDPDYFIAQMQIHNSPAMGLRAFIQHIKTAFPNIMLGYFNKPREEFMAR